MEDLVSIIIPLYNRKHLIRRCVESVCSQTFKNLEIIVVDDGSTDEPDAVLAELSRDPRVKIIRKPNGGVSSARNAGLEAAVGTYVMFVDSDDFLLPLATESVLEVARKSLADCVIFLMSIDAQPWLPCMEEGAVRNYASLKDYMADCRESGGLHSPVNKLFKRSLIKDLRFLSGISMGEDMIFCFMCLSRCGSIAVLNSCLYIVDRSSTDSLSRRYDENGFTDIRSQWMAYRQYLEPICTKEKKHFWMRFFWTCYIEAVRKLYLKSGRSIRSVLQTLKSWSADEMVSNLLPEDVPHVAECRFLRNRHFILTLAMIRLRYSKDFVLRHFFGRSKETLNKTQCHRRTEK